MTLTQNLVPTCRYCLNCTKFDQLILRKIIKIVATRCPILRLKCTKFDFGWGSAPDPTGGAYSAPQTPQLNFRGPTSKGSQGREGRGKGGEGSGGIGRGGKGREEGGGEGVGRHSMSCLRAPQTQLRHWCYPHYAWPPSVPQRPLRQPRLMEEKSHASHISQFFLIFIFSSPVDSTDYYPATPIRNFRPDIASMVLPPSV